MRVVLLIVLLALAGGCQCGAPQDLGGPDAGAMGDASGGADAAASATASTATTSAASDPEQPVEPPGPAFVSDERADLIIRGGTVIDGTDGPPLRADVVVRGGKITHVGKVGAGVKAAETIDASGKVVTPGFIDTHSHGDPLGTNRNFLAMGVTTMCLGQDGKSASNDRLRYWKKQVAGKRLAVNVMPFVGHATVRELGKVGASKDPTPKQLERMAKLVAQELDDGAWGLTTGLEYTPGMLAGAAELAAIAKPVAERDGVVMSHLRSEDDDQIDASIDELVAQGKQSGARVHVAHIKVVYGKGTARADALLAKLQAARDDGVRVTADIYPYNASYTTISIVFPDWAKPPASYKRVVRERRAELAEYLRTKVVRRGGPEATLFGNDPFRGMTLAQVAAQKKKPFEDVLIDDIGLGGASAAYFVMDEALQSRLLRDPHVMVATDGGSSSRHPRGYGTFAKVIREHVVKQKALTIREAVRKMSGLPAKTLKLPDRGTLVVGAAADVLVFDPEKIADNADYEHPNRLSTGMDWVIVNGVVAIAGGEAKGQKGGRLLLRK